MFSTFITVTLFVSLAIQGVSASFAISTPKLLQCQPVQISWAPAAPPYTVEIVPAAEPCGNAIETIQDLTGTIFHYTSKLVTGTQVVLYISDSAGNEAWSGNITIGGTSNNTCIPGTPSVSSVPSKLTTPSVTPTSSSASKPSNVPLGGAINAGPDLGTSGALSVCQASAPLLCITALAAMLALTL